MLENNSPRPPSPPSKQASACAQAERLVGTMGGGMDQTISCLARPLRALHMYPASMTSPIEVEYSTF